MQHCFITHLDDRTSVDDGFTNQVKNKGSFGTENFTNAEIVSLY